MQVFNQLRVYAITLLSIILFSSCLSKPAPEHSKISIKNSFELPEDKNKELVETTCTACHTGHLLFQNTMDRKHWDKTITWMQQKQNMWKLEVEERAAILDYLEKYFSPQKQKGGQDKVLGLIERRINPLPQTLL